MAHIWSWMTVLADETRALVYFIWPTSDLWGVWLVIRLAYTTLDHWLPEKCPRLGQNLLYGYFNRREKLSGSMANLKSTLLGHDKVQLWADFQLDGSLRPFCTSWGQLHLNTTRKQGFISGFKVVASATWAQMQVHTDRHAFISLCAHMQASNKEWEHHMVLRFVYV